MIAPETSPPATERRPGKAPKAAETIAAQLRAEIVSGSVAEGERLGSEQDMLARFNVSRPTLREAIRILEAESLLEIVRGARGGLVARRPDEGHTLRAVAVVLESRGVTLTDVYEARTIIEPPAARRVAESRSRGAQVKALAALVDHQEAAMGDPVAYAAANVAFHEALVAASGNHTLALFAEVLHDLVAAAVAQAATEAGTDAATGSARQGVRAHRRLLDLMAAGRGAEAEDYWRRHMESVGRILLRGAGTAAVVRHNDVTTPAHHDLTTT